MSFQAYLDNIRLKTGKSPEDFKQIAAAKGLLAPEIKASQVVTWLKQDFNLGHGHAMAIYTTLKGLKNNPNQEEILEKHFLGEKQKWKPVFELLIKKAMVINNNITYAPAVSYISMLISGKKFAIIKIKKDSMILGIKAKGLSYTERFEKTDYWNTMVTHKVNIQSSSEIDKELLSWLKKASSADL